MQSVAGKAQGELLVLGSNGRLGQVLAKVWSPSSTFRVTWQARNKFAPYMNVLNPLSEPQKFAKMAAGKTVLFNLAGKVPAPGADLWQNVTLARATLNAALAAGCPHVFLFSSAAVYGVSRDNSPLPESADLCPISAYGYAKAKMEETALDFAAIHPDVSVHILRLGNVVGADSLLGRTGRGVVVLDQMRNDGFPRRSYIGPATMASVFAALLTKPRRVPQVLNIAAPGLVGMDQLLAAAGISFLPQPAPKGTLPLVALCTETLEKLYEFEPMQSMAQAMVAEWHAVRSLSSIATQGPGLEDPVPNFALRAGRGGAMRIA